MIPETASNPRRRTSPSAVQIAYPCPPAIHDALAAARRALAAESLPQPELELAAEAAEIVGGLTEDQALALAVLGESALAAGRTPESVARTLGEPPRRAAEELARLVALDLGAGRPAGTAPDAIRTEALRKMLLAVASDPRLVVARLAIALVRLRAARNGAPEERQRLAETTRAIFAPLANRLGLWQLKWELEDLAFRYLEPEDYRLIATALAEKRVDREHYIAGLCARLREELAAVGVSAEVAGRPKHLYSIHRKMRRKNLAFEELFDVRAVRIVVATVADCYAALGLVHSRWPYIAGEFEDYIATPKDNFYRSIHTAVVGPEGKLVEVQIRTAEMHAHSELGLAAHWRYKEGGGRDADYERKIEWVRRLLEPGEPAGVPGAAEDDDFLDRVRSELFEDRVYALTPKGEVVDLVRGATPLDFAYQVHTDLGHRTRGAKVNGRIVPLTHALRNGEVVEIITQKSAAPSRDWLSPDARVLVSARSRAKVRAWFRRQSEAAETSGEPSAAAATGGGATTSTPVEAPAAPLRRRRRRPGLAPPPVAIEGLDDLPITLARCCAPMRPQPIVGYVTVGRGVTVHRTACPGLTRMRSAHPERALLALWTTDETQLLDVEITVDAWNRHGLVRDLSDVLAGERLGIDSMSTTTTRETGTARAVLRFAVPHLDALARIEQRLRRVQGVTAVRRSG
jgi:GTP pyrophosphokinase